MPTTDGAPNSVALPTSMGDMAIPADGGLTSAEAAARLQQSGPNAIPEERPHPVGALLKKFWGVVPWMLELALIIDLFLGKWIEAAVIAALLVSNGIVAFRQESRAREALELLRHRLTVSARVFRDGKWRKVPARELVPGDLVHLRVGDVVPADLRLTAGQIGVDQSQLTGEALALSLQAQGTAFAGSLVTRGEASAVVTATGARTYFGKTAELVRTAEAPRRVEMLIVKIATYLGAVVVVFAVLAFAAMILRGTPASEMLPFGVMLLVASVPVALPMMFSMSAALGARKLAEGGVLVTRLSAIQDAASMDVLCLDKTGTITENHLRLARVEPFAGTPVDELLQLAAMASDEATQDSIDLAILGAASERGLLASLPPRLGFVPFDPSTKRSEASVERDGGVLRVVKGAPAIIAELASASWPEIAPTVARLSADGSRVLAVASGKDAQLSFKGFVTLSDPPRPDSAALIADLRKRGVRVLLVTGDGEATARAIAAQVGITGDVAPAGTLKGRPDAGGVSGFAIFPGVYPEEKFRLIEGLQRSGHVVGMTGDGVNDAPALRQADVGIAVAQATDVAKAAAGLVLTRPGLGEIVTAIDESRRIFRRMKNFVLTMTSRKLSMPTFFALGVILAGSFVLQPVQIVLLLLVGDLASMAVSTDRVTPSAAPDRWAITPLMATGLSIAAILLALNGAVFLSAASVFRLDAAATQTLVFVWLVFGASQAVLYLTRGQGFFWSRPYPGRLLILATVAAVGLVTLLASQGWLMAPIPLPLIGAMLLLAMVFLIVGDLLQVGIARLASAGQNSHRSATRPLNDRWGRQELIVVGRRPPHASSDGRRE